MTAWRRWADSEERAEEKAAPQQPMGHDRLCGCEDCMRYYSHLGVQRIIDKSRKPPRPRIARGDGIPANQRWMHGAGPGGMWGSLRRRGGR
jgi:hypothetical protein